MAFSLTFIYKIMASYNFIDLIHFYLKWFTLELIVISRHTFILFFMDYLECVDDRFLFRFLSWRRFFSSLARSTYFFLCSGVIRDHNLPAARAITVTCSFGFLLRSRRKKMMKGFVVRGRTLCLSRVLWLAALPLPFAGCLPFPGSALRERRNCKVRFCVPHWSCRYVSMPTFWIPTLQANNSFIVNNYQETIIKKSLSINTYESKKGSI